MKNRCISDFLCNECFGIIATIFGTVITLLFIGILFYSLGISMQIFYIVVGVGFIISLSVSLVYMRKVRSKRRMANSDNESVS